jgi:LacI family transcriptional regulator
MKATIRDVAKEAGVSISMVSRALSGRGYVGKETGERIRSVVKRLGYHPSPLAQGMRDRGTRTLGILFGWQPENLVTNFFTGQILAGVFEASVKSGYQILVNDVMSEVQGWEDGPECQRILNDTRLEGLLLVAPPQLLVSAFKNAPYRVLMVNHQDPAFDFVDADQAAAVKGLFAHLLAKGHVRIGFMAGGDFNPAAASRLAAFQACAAEAGLAPEQAPIFHGQFHRESGAEGGRHFMSLPRLPSAVIASTDLMALGALEAFRSLPRELRPAVAGIDDHPEAAAGGLTTMRQPFFEMSRLATEALIKGLEGKPGEFQLRIPMELVVRDSA